MTATTICHFDQEPGSAPLGCGQAPETCAASKQERSLIELVRAALRNAGHSTIGELDVDVSEGVVTLWGRVTTYYQKQLAQAVVQRVAGVRGVANGLEVVGQRVSRHREGEEHKALQEAPHLSRR